MTGMFIMSLVTGRSSLAFSRFIVVHFSMPVMICGMILLSLMGVSVVVFVVHKLKILLCFY
jgi:hypothetical protein